MTHVLLLDCDRGSVWLACVEWKRGMGIGPWHLAASTGAFLVAPDAHTRKKERNMNSALKHTIIAMATATLSMTAACKSDSGPEAAEATAGAEAAKAQEGATEASCGEGNCGGAKKAGDASEASCGEGSCG